MRTMAVLLLGIMAWLVATPAHASFGDCTRQSYLANFERYLGSASHYTFDCAESERQLVVTADGPRQIRVIRHIGDDWIVSRGMEAEIMEGVRSAVGTLREMGSFRMADTTVLIADTPPPPEGVEQFKHVFAQAWMPSQSSPECFVVVFVVNDFRARGELAGTIAHELFHCVQFASLGDARMSSAGARGLDQWWMEGSAEWFAATSVPRLDLQHREDAFSEGINRATPLFRLGYDAYPFFLWLEQASGRRAVLPFLHQMAPDDTATAQIAAMNAALPQGQWQTFVRDLHDRRIRRSGDHELRVGAVLREAWNLTASTTQTVVLEPFVAYFHDVSLACGTWRVAAAPDRWYQARPSTGSGSGWGPFPVPLTVSGGTPGRFRYAGFNTSNTRVTQRIRFEQVADCSTCEGESADAVRDQCVVGQWEETSGGLLDAMRARLPGMRIDLPRPIYQFSADGRYTRTVNPGQIGAADSRADIGNPVVSVGRWSTSDGKLHLCGVNAAGEAVLRSSNTEGRIPFSIGGARDPEQMDYRCSGDSLDTHFIPPAGSGLGAIDTTYRRRP